MHLIIDLLISGCVVGFILGIIFDRPSHVREDAVYVEELRRKRRMEDFKANERAWLRRAKEWIQWR